MPVAALAVAAVVCLLGYVALAVPAAWFPSASTVSWSADELRVMRGHGALERGSLLVAPNDASSVVIISIDTSLRSSDYPVIAWEAVDVPERAEVRLLWRNNYAPTRLNTVPVTIASGRLLPSSLVNEPNWIGTIAGIGLAIQGPFAQPMRISGVAARPMGARETLAERFREWLTFESWTGTSINTIAGGADVQDLPLPALLAGAIALAALAWLGLAWRFAMPSTAPVALAAMFLAAWIICDARWMWNLTRQAQATLGQYGGKDPHERSLAAPDGALFAFIERVRAKLPAAPARVFMVADAHYFRGRGAYHLYPHNVYFDPYQNTIPPPERMHAGDYLVVYQRHGVQYDRAAGRLRWDGHAPVQAELLLAEAGSALFRIR